MNDISNIMEITIGDLSYELICDMNTGDANTNYWPCWLINQLINQLIS